MHQRGLSWSGMRPECLVITHLLSSKLSCIYIDSGSLTLEMMILQVNCFYVVCVFVFFLILENIIFWLLICIVIQMNIFVLIK